MKTSELLTKVKEVLECDCDINLNDQLLDIEGWDSLGILSVIAMLDELGLKIDLQRLQNISTVSEFINLCGAVDD